MGKYSIYIVILGIVTLAFGILGLCLDETWIKIVMICSDALLVISLVVLFLIGKKGKKSE